VADQRLAVGRDDVTVRPAINSLRHFVEETSDTRVEMNNQAFLPSLHRFS